MPSSWWAEMAQSVEDSGHAAFSAAWYAAMRDLYRERFPNADARSLQNMDLFVEWAEAAERRRAPDSLP